MGLADLHLHTIYSYDGTASVSAVLSHAKRIGLNVIAVTDHDVIAGALKAVELAPNYGVEVIPGIEVTTAEGDLLALFIKEKVDAGLSLLETLFRVRELGGVCIAPHPMANGMSMKSLSANSILTALRNPEAAKTLIGVETYNATAIGRIGNRHALELANQLNIAHVGGSDAHIVDTIGFGATEFAGSSATDLLTALKNSSTKIHKRKEWSALRILGSWGVRYMRSAFARLMM
jgi:hypothetical protein